MLFNHPQPQAINGQIPLCYSPVVIHGSRTLAILPSGQPFFKLSPLTRLTSLSLCFASPLISLGWGGLAYAQSSDSSGWPSADQGDQVFLYPDEETEHPAHKTSMGGPAEPVLVYPDDDYLPESTAIPVYVEPTANEALEASATRIPSPSTRLEGIPIYPEIETTSEGIPIYPEINIHDGSNRTPSVAVQADHAASDHLLDSVVVRSLQLSGAAVLPPEIVETLLHSQLNRPADFQRLDRAALAIDQWYLENGYALSQVEGFIPDPSGVLIVNVVEPRVEDIHIRYIDETGSDVDKDGNTIEGRTQDEFLLRELYLEEGDVFNQNDIVRDIRHLMSLGLFEDANVALEVDEDATVPTVDVIYSLRERLSRSFQASGGVSTELGLFAGANYSDRNVGGQGNSLRFGTQVGSRGLTFNTGFTHPYRDSRPNQLGYDINAFRSTGQSLTFSDEVAVANGDDARERQLGGGVAVMRPLGEWDAELGLNYTRTSIRDESGDLAPVDERGNALTISDSGIDDLVTLGFGVTQDRRVNPLNPNAGSILSLSTEQSLPVGNGSIAMNRVRANYAEFIPLKLFNTGRISNPEVFAFNVQAGTIVGELPPYEAFDLGGSHSVRGYARGDVGSGRHFMQATAEYRFPVTGPLGAVLFTDFATDLGSGDDVPGDPAGERDKPGIGLGYGVGFRVGSPLGLIRADFGFNDQGENQFHFGFGQRF